MQHPRDPRLAIRAWMTATAIVVVLTLVVGGVTRLTESGLSITEWNPIGGVVPPFSDAGWQRLFQSYLQIPEAQTVHRGITIDQFKTLFWWEWAHRVVARLAGVVIALPFFVLAGRRAIPRHLMGRMALLPILVGAQGALGWYMVKSGLSDRTDVSQYRLVAHLGLALVIFVLAAWTALSPDVRQRPVHPGAATLASLVFLTILSGGFVAGLDAGQIYNTFPNMGPGLVPPGYAQFTPWWRNLFENPAAVQFNHRLLALTTATVVLILSLRERAREGRVPRAWRATLACVALQVALGVGTLLLTVPVPLAALHQLVAVALLTSTLWAAHETVHHSPVPSSLSTVRTA